MNKELMNQLVDMIEEMLLTREGEVVTKELARERANNIVCGMQFYFVKGKK